MKNQIVDAAGLYVGRVLNYSVRLPDARSELVPLLAQRDNFRVVEHGGVPLRWSLAPRNPGPRLYSRWRRAAWYGRGASEQFLREDGAPLPFDSLLSDGTEPG